MYKKIIKNIILVLTLISLVSCSGKKEIKVSDLKMNIDDMLFDDLVVEAIKESNGKRFVVKSALPIVEESTDAFLEYLSKINPDYDLEIVYEDSSDEDIFNTINEEKKNKDSVSVVIGKNLSVYKELKEKDRLLSYIPLDYRKANGIKKENEPSDMIVATKFSPIYTQNDELKDIDNMWKFLFCEDDSFYINVYPDEYDTFLDNLLTEKGVKILKDAYEALSDEEKNNIKEIFENDITINGLNETFKDSDTLKDKLDVLNFMYMVDKKLVQSEDFDEDSIILGHNANYKGISGYFNNYYIYADSYSPLPYTTLCYIAFVTSKFDGFKAIAEEPFIYTTNNLIREEITDYYMDKRSRDKIVDRGYDWWKNNQYVIEKNEEEVGKILKDIDKIAPSPGVG